MEFPTHQLFTRLKDKVGLKVPHFSCIKSVPNAASSENLFFLSPSTVSTHSHFTQFFFLPQARSK